MSACGGFQRILEGLSSSTEVTEKRSSTRRNEGNEDERRKVRRRRPLAGVTDRLPREARATIQTDDDQAARSSRFLLPLPRRQRICAVHYRDSIPAACGAVAIAAGSRRESQSQRRSDLRDGISGAGRGKSKHIDRTAARTQQRF